MKKKKVQFQCVLHLNAIISRLKYDIDLKEFALVHIRKNIRYFDGFEISKFFERLSWELSIVKLVAQKGGHICYPTINKLI